MLTMEELAEVKAAIANGATTIEGSKDMQRQFAAGISKEIKVVKAFDENDSYVETYKYLEDYDKDMEESRYTGRFTYGGGEWIDLICGVADGYFEPNTGANDDVVYIICKPDGTPIMAAGNGCGCSFPTAEAYSDRWFKKWAAENDVQTNGDNFEEWILSYRDPADSRVANWLNEDSCHCYKENWIYGRGKQLISEKVAEYEYMGFHYYLFKDTVEHEVCGAKYTEYILYDTPEPSKWNCGQLMGRTFNSNKRGSAMSPREARQTVQAVLESMYGKLDFSARPRDEVWNQNMVLITECEWSRGNMIIRSLPDYDVVDMILRKVGTRDAYNRKEFTEKLAKERQELAGKLYTNNKQGIEQMAKDHPEITAENCSYGVNDYYLPKDRR